MVTVLSYTMSTALATIGITLESACPLITLLLLDGLLVVVLLTYLIKFYFELLNLLPR